MAAPESDIDIDISLAKKQAADLHSQAKAMLTINAPEQVAATTALSRQTGLPPSIVEKLKPRELDPITKLPRVEKMQRDAQDDPILPRALDNTEIMREAPDMYDGAVTIWSLAKKLKGTYDETIGRGLDDKNIGDEMSNVALQIHEYELRGEEPPADLLQRREDVKRRSQELGSPDWTDKGEWPRIVTTGMAQSADMWLIDKESTDRFVRWAFPQEAGDFLAESGLADKIVTAGQVGLTAASPAAGVAVGRANTFYEAYRLEKGSMIFALQNTLDDQGNRMDPEIVDTFSTIYGGMAALTELASQFFELPIVIRATKAAKAAIFRKTVEVMNKPNLRRSLVRAVGTIGFGAFQEGVEESAQFLEQEFATFFAKQATEEFASARDFSQALDQIFSDEGMSKIIDAAMTGAIGGGGQASIFTGVQLAGDAASIRQAQVREEAFKALADGVKDSDLTGRAGDAVAALITEAGQATKVDKIFIDPDKISETLNQLKVDPNDVVADLTHEIAQARLDSRPVEIDAGTFAVRIAGSDLFAKIKDDIKFAKDGLSKNERTQELEKAKKLVDETLDAMEKSEQQQFEKSSAALRDSFAKQIYETERYTKREAALNAAIFEGIYRNIAAAMTRSQGRLVTPEEVYQTREKLSIIGPGVKLDLSAAKPAEALSQTVLRVTEKETGQTQEFTGDTAEEAMRKAQLAVPALLNEEEAPRFTIEQIEKKGRKKTATPIETVNDGIGMDQVPAGQEQPAPAQVAPDETLDGEGKAQIFAAPPGAEDRVRRKVGRAREGKGYRSGKGEPRNARKRLVLADGSVVSIGRIRPQDWVERIESVKLTPEQVQDFRNWYREVYGIFMEIFGDEAPIFTASWLMAQQNTSPPDALRNALRVREQILNGTLGKPGTKKGGVAHERLVAFWSEALKNKGIRKLSALAGAQKLYDFVDSALLKKRRTWMGNSPEGGEPAVIDVHTSRDAGFIDSTFRDRLLELGVNPKKLEDVELDLKGAPTEAQYERAAEWLHEVRDYLNETGAFGGNFEHVAEVQALGWMALLIQTKQPAADARASIASRVFRMSAEAVFGEGAPLAEKLPDLASDTAMSPEDRLEITHAGVTAAFAQAAAALGDPPVVSVSTGLGAWNRFTNASTQVELLASEEVAADMAAAVGYLLQQTEVWSGRELRLTPSGQLPAAATDWFVDIESPALSDRVNLTTLWEAILRESGMQLGFSPTASGIRLYVPLRRDDGKPNKWGTSNAEKAKDALRKALIDPILRAGENVPFEIGVRATPGSVIKARNDWKENPDGQGYLSRFQGRPGTVERLRAARGTVEDVLARAVDGTPRIVEQLAQPVLGERGRSPGEGDAEGRANLGGLGLLGDDGEPISLSDLHQGTKNSESAQRAVYRAVGMEVEPGVNTSAELKIYPLADAFGEDLDQVKAKLDEWLARTGWSYRVFGPKNGDRPAIYPDFSDPSTPSYDQRVVWIFDPALEEGSFRDHAYTLAWRVTHEVAHGIVNDRLTEKYGGRGRRAGAMGVEIKGPYFKGGRPLTLADAMRAVEWEAETFVEQRRILREDFGIEITDEQFNRENAVNTADAVYRSITGQFGNPGEIGVHPTNIDPQELLAKSFDVLREISRQINGDVSERLEQPAYHGTPHVFDRFDLTKIGTGEGFQAFGWGLYFTTSEGIAKFYREKLTSRELRFRNTTVSPINLHKELQAFGLRGEELAASAAVLSEIGVLNAREVIAQKLVEFQERLKSASSEIGRDRIRERIAALQSLNPDDFSVDRGGMVATVEIPESEELLDWDAPLADQPKMLEKLLSAAGVTESEAIQAFKASNKQLGDSLKGTSADRDAALKQSNSPAVKLGEAIGQRSQKWSGQDFYRALSRFLGSDKSASAWLFDAGIPGLKYAAGQISSADSDHTNFVIWDEAAIAMVQRMQERQGDVVRGEYIRTSAQSFIRMTEASDLSTLLHESAHLYLSTLARMVQDGTADERMQADVEAILRYLEVDSVDKLTLPYADGRQWDGRVDIPHEKFARSFEAYLAEGRAPSEGMRKAFRAFQSWMIAVYGSLKEIAKRLGVQLDPEIRGVFDRMIALEDVLAEASQPVFRSREEAAMSEAQWEQFVESAGAIREEAQAKVIAPIVRRVTAEKKKARRALFDSLYDDYATKVDEEPVYRAIRFLRDTDPAVELPEGTLNRDQVVALYARPEIAAKVLAAVPRGTVTRNGTLDLQLVAEYFGFPTGSRLLDAMAKALPREQEIRRRVNEDIASRAEFQDEAVVQDVQDLIGGEELGKRIQMELKALRALARETMLPAARRAVAEVGAPQKAEESRNRVQAAKDALQQATEAQDEQAIANAQVELVAAEQAAKAEAEGRVAQQAARRRTTELERAIDERAIRDRAREVVVNRPSGDIASDRRVWAKELRKAQVAARKAVASRDYLAATRSMERAALLNWMIVEADDAIARQKKTLEFARSFDRTKVRDSLRTGGGSQELELIDILLEKYDLRRDVPVDPSLRGAERVREIARRREKAREEKQQREARWRSAFPSLMAWANDKKANLEVFDVDETLFANPNRKHWKELSVGEMDGLDATLRNMKKLAQNEVAKAKGALNGKLDAVADKAVAAMLSKNLNRRARDRKLDETFRGAARRGIDTIDALHINMGRLFRWMAGDDRETNPLIEIAEAWGAATDREAVWMNDLAGRYQKLLEKLHKNGLDYRTTIDIPHLNRKGTRGELIAFVLNMGTESNLKKLKKGFRIEDQQVMDIAKMLSKSELQFVQEVWDLVNSLFVEMADNHYKLTGVKVKKIEPREFIMPDGTIMRGGYYPMAYDPNESGIIDRIKDRQFLQSMFDHYASAPTTSHGFTESRKDEFAAPLLLDLDVIHSHLVAVVHDIVWRETLRDSWKIFHRPQLKAAIVEMYGKEYFDAIEHRIRMLAGAVPAPQINLRWLQAGIQKLMRNQTAYALAGAFSTSIAQFGSFTNSIPRVADGNIIEGTGRMLQALNRVVFSFGDTKRFVWENSPRMRNRAASMDASIREHNAALEGRTDWIANTRRFGFAFIAWADYFVSSTTWLARYGKIMEETSNKDLAIAEANYVVERTQGAGNVKDMAQIQDTDPLFRPMVMFYSYFSAFYNELHAITEDAAGGKLKQAAAGYLLIAIIPGIISDLLKGNVPDDEAEDPEKEWLKWLAYHAFLSPFQSVVVVRDLMSAVVNLAAGKTFAGYDLTPATGLLDQTARTIGTIGGAVFDEDKELNVYDLIAEATALGGQAKGLPFARQLNIIASNFAKAEETGTDITLSDFLIRRRKEK